MEQMIWWLIVMCFCGIDIGTIGAKRRVEIAVPVARPKTHSVKLSEYSLSSPTEVNTGLNTIFAAESTMTRGYVSKLSNANDEQDPRGTT